MQAQQDVIFDIAVNITSYYSTYYPTYLQSYVLTVVQNNGILFTHEYDNFIDFTQSIRSITNPPTETVCDDALLAGVSSMLDTPSMRKYLVGESIIEIRKTS